MKLWRPLINSVRYTTRQVECNVQIVRDNFARIKNNFCSGANDNRLALKNRDDQNDLSQPV